MGIRKTIWLTVVLLGCWFSAKVVANNQRNVENDVRWQRAESLAEQGLFGQAATLYEQVYNDYPDSQKAALRCAIALDNRETAEEDELRLRGRTANKALPIKSDLPVSLASVAANYERAIEVKPFGYWGKVGLYKLAKYHYKRGDEKNAKRFIEILRNRFPGTRWSARADLLEAELNGEDTAAAEAVVAREVAAWNAYREAAKEKPNKGNQDVQRIKELDAVARAHSGTGGALLALEAKGHLLIRNERSDEAIEAFEEIEDLASVEAENSPIVQRARGRIAALYHAAGRKKEALLLFEQLASRATDPEIVSNASLQAAGLYFELLQPKRWRKEDVSSEEWNELRNRCQQVRELEKVKPQEVARADLMILESYLWEKNPQECLEQTTRFIADHDESNYRRELATAHLFAGESLLRLKSPSEARVHFTWITNEYETNGRIWPWDYLISRTYYRLYDSLLRSGVEAKEIDTAAQKILDEFPDSRGADLVRVSLEQRAAIAEKEGIESGDHPTEVFEIQ